MTNESSKQALNIWTAVPADIRTKILSNVFCGQCRGVVTIADYSVELIRPDIVLQGFGKVDVAYFSSLTGLNGTNNPAF